jgi:hypothetical protein
MAAVYVNNIVIDTGSNFIQSFDLESADTNSALNLTGYTANSQMRKYSGSSTAVNFSVSISLPETLGRIIISLGSTETVNLKPGRYVYDILITETATSKKTRVVEGMALVREGVTR